MSHFSIIKDLAKQRGLSLKELAVKIGILPSSLHHLIKAGATSTATIERIAEILQIPVGYFFDDSYDKSKPEALANLEKEVEFLKQLIAEKERIITLLMSKEQKP